MTIKEFAVIVMRSVVVGLAISAILIGSYRMTIKKSTQISKSRYAGQTVINMTKWETDIFGNERLVDWEVLKFSI